MTDAADPNTNTTEPNSVQIPAEWATDDTLKSFFTESDGADGTKVKSFDLGALHKSYDDTKAALPVVPKTADEYTYQFPEGFPQDQIAAEFKARQAFALKAGLSADQFSQLMNHDLAMVGEQSAKQQAERTEAHAALKKEWGKDYDGNLAAAKKAIVAVFGKRIAEMYDPEKDTDPDIIRGMFTIAKGLKEDVIKTGTLPAATDPQGRDTRPRSSDGRPMLQYPSMKKAS